MKDVILCREGFTLRAALAVFCLILGGAMLGNAYGQTPWKAPSSANSLKNPYAGNANATAAGKNLYKQFCAICHGDRGKGDGLAGMTLKPRPANFTKTTVQSQTDGAIFWKMTNGRAPMASYKTVLTEDEAVKIAEFLKTAN